MATTKKYVQIPTAYLSGSGTIIGAVNIVVNSFVDIYGNTLTMTDFGDTGYGTIEPDTNNEESFIFTSITANANGTTTLGGIASTLAKSPYTATSGLVRQHSGGTKVVVSDTAAFWNTFANKANDETVTGLYTFIQNPIGLNPGAIADASTTNIGIARSSSSPNLTLGVVTVTIASPAVFTLTAHGLTLSDRVQFTTTGALPTGLSVGTTYYVIAAGLTANSFEVSTSQLGSAVNTSGSQSGTHTLIKTTPVYVATTDYRILTNSFGVDSGTNAAHVVTLPNGAVSTLLGGALFSYLVNVTNIGVVTAAVGGTAAKTIKKLGGTTDLVAGDIVAGQLIEIEYNATSGFYQLLTPVATPPITSITSLQTTLTAAEALADRDLVTAYYYQADGGVLYDNKTTTTGGAVASLTQSFTVGANSNKCLIAVLTTNAVGADSATPSYNGSAMTQVGSNQDFGGNNRTRIFRLFAPTAGANNFTITFTNAATNYSLSLYSYYNVNQSAIDGVAQAAASTVNYTPTAQGTLVFTFLVASGAAPTGGSNMQLNQQSSSSTGSSYYIFSGDSGQIVPATGTALTFSATGSAAITSVGLAPSTVPSSGYVAKASASNTTNTVQVNRYSSILGFAIGSASSLASVTVQTDGYVTGLTGLIPMVTYYASNTNGLLSITAGTNSKKIGVAVTTTTLLIKQDN
jgi:hypothetical protein